MHPVYMGFQIVLSPESLVTMLARCFDFIFFGRLLFLTKWGFYSNFYIN
jgi:hypothetical protein